MDFTAYMERAPQGGETLAGESFLMSSGGKGLNQAIALSRAGASTYMLGAVGDDSLGKDLLFLLEKEKIHSLVKTCEGCPTGTALIFVEKSGQNRIVIIHGANYALTIEDVKHAIDKVDAEYVCFQLENPVDVVIEGIRYAKKKGKIVVLNPAPACQLSEDVFQYIDIFTPNETELAFYTNKEDDLSKSSQMMLDKGIKHLIVTLGEKGALYASKDYYEIIPTFKVKAIDTVAAGDCFNGYLVASIAEGMDIVEAINRANKASSIAVSRLGASSSIPYLDELK